MASEQSSNIVNSEPVSDQSPLTTSSERTAHLDDGFNCEVQTLYEGSPKCKCCKHWVEEYPDDLPAAVEQQPDVKRKALIVRMRKNHAEGKPLVLDSIVVQSPSLLKTLGEVFEGYEGITAGLDKMVFRAPFHPFYYRWQRFEQIMARQEKEDPSAFPFIQLLFRILDAEIHDAMAEISGLLQRGVITYARLWALFEPGKHAVSVSNGNERYLVVESCRYNVRGRAVLTAKYIDWNGECFGYENEIITIPGFDGTRNITELNIFPAQFHQSREEAEQRAISRGVKFQALRGMHYMAHSGVVEDRYGKQRNSIDGRIVIDAVAYFRGTFSNQPPLASLSTTSIKPQLRVSDDSHAGQDRLPRYRPEMEVVSMMNMESAEMPLLEHKAETGSYLTEEQLLICTTHVRGFSLKLKIWVKFKVQDIRDITWNDTAFPNLMLPEGFKDLVLSFLKWQSSSKDDFEDVVEGKGMGSIMLLVGNPGTGKTLTAEAVADKVRKPLYILSSGDMETKDFDKNMNQVSELTERWGAVLLLDECDVVIQERSLNDNNIVHRSIASAFLRTLEYYRGFIIMTSNNAATIDKAFQSRIHLTLHYPDLDAAVRLHVWKQFTTKSRRESKLTNEHLERLARLPLNGRQIRNVIKTATLLAAHKNTPLCIEQIRTVLQVTNEVDMRLLSSEGWSS